ncbi:hypothetical protein FRC11_014597 [Ceratobasidium sp. 423]|nr:hypothetical protein FRC11_014597 [Ceratobasidium sp. 423]
MIDGTLEELPTVGQPSEEPLAPAGCSLTGQTGPTALPHIEPSASIEQAIGTDSAPVQMSPSPGAGLTLPNDAVSNTPLPQASESDSDLEPEEYVDVETICTSEDEDTELEEVEKDGDFEMMHDWDPDF